MPSRRISLAEVGHQNIVYSEAEQTAIKNALKTTEASLLRLRTLRNDAACQRRRLNDQIHRCQVALAPYKTIPKEIWLYIFEPYCQSGRLSTCDTKQSPVVLMQVYSVWRRIVLSMPKLWSDVILGENANLARIWLERAGNIPRALETTRCFSLSNRPLTIQSFICSFPFKKLHLTECDAVSIDFRAIPVESLLLLEDFALLRPARCRGISLSPNHFPNLVSLQIDTYIMPHFRVFRPFSTWKKLGLWAAACARHA